MVSWKSSVLAPASDAQAAVDMIKLRFPASSRERVFFRTKADVHMHRLPALRAEHACWRLPWTADDLRQAATAVLAGESATNADRWFALLSDSPCLALWAVCTSDAWRTAPPESWGELALWLSRHAPSMLSPTVADEADPASATEDAPPSSRRQRQQRSDWLVLADAWRQASGKRGVSQEDPVTGDSPSLRWGAGWLAASETTGRDLAATIAPHWLVQSWRNRATLSGMDVLRLLRAELTPRAWSSPDDVWLGGADESASDLLLGALETRRQQQQQDARMRQQLQQDKLDALRQLAYGASHELNNPLANIAARAQNLLHGETNPERRRKIEAINRQAFRAHEMIADMMLFANPPQMKTGPVRLSMVVSTAIRGMQEMADAQQTQLGWQCDDPQLTVAADAEYLTEAIRALIRNALEAVVRGGSVQVRIAAEHQEPGVVITVSDDGPGLTEADREHLFDPYYSGREAGRGLGLGLSKTWRIINQHGGHIQVDSSPNQGAVFQLHLRS